VATSAYPAPTCKFCKQIINIDQDRFTDGDGAPVHEECYMAWLVSKGHLNSPHED